jgi:hypothetical protein
VLFTLDRIIKSIDAVLELSSIYQVENAGFGIVIVLFFLREIITLVDCVLEDFGLPFSSKCLVKDGWPGPINIDSNDRGINNRNKHCDRLRQTNAFTALEVVQYMTSNKRIQDFLRLIHLNMYVLVFLYNFLDIFSIYNLFNFQSGALLH